MGSVSWRKRGHRYLVSWRLDDGSQGGKTVDAPDEARDLAAQKRLEMRRGTWRGRQRGRLSFNAWATEWWDTWAADEPSPTSLASAESRLRLHVRPWFADRLIDKITPADVRRWQAHLDRTVGPATVAQCRSLALRIFQFAMDEGAIDVNPIRKVPPPKRRVDPEEVFGQAKRRALTPEEAGRLLACCPLFWWDHLLTFLGTGLRFGELAGLRRRRVHLGRELPMLEVGPPDMRPAGSAVASSRGPRATPASARCPWPLWWSRRSAGSFPPAVTPMTWCSPVPAAARACRAAPGRCCHATTSARTYHDALAKLADPAAPLRPTARRTLLSLRDSGPQHIDQLAARLTTAGRRPIRPATVAAALGELHTAGLAAVDDHDQDGLIGRWMALPVARDPLLDAVELHGAHDLRHTYATWLEDAGIPARVIDELMGHQASSHGGHLGGSAIGAHYRHTTPEMAARVVDAIQQRLTVVLQVAERSLEKNPNRSALRVF